METIRLPFKVKEPILACGADLKGAFALARGGEAYLFDSSTKAQSQSRANEVRRGIDGFGDLSELDNFTGYKKAIKAAESKLKIKPKLIICDLHPGYFSTRFAENYKLSTVNCELSTIQHHEAHIASGIVDNNIKGKVLGVAFDGTGYGPDRNIWGGEFFSGSVKSFKRVAHLGYIPMPGGEACIKEPWRMAASYLYSVFGADFIKLKIDFVRSMDKRKWAVLKNMIDKNINSPLTSSMGRFFDAAASLILNKNDSGFEAQLPIELEKIIEPGIDAGYNADNSADIIKGIVKDIEKKAAASMISARFHNSIAGLILKTAKKFKIKKIVLSGGVFQNRYLADKTLEILEKNNFTVYTHSGIQTNDCGIPIGQIAIANARLHNTQYTVQN